jgi:hypothetical protein
VPPAAKPVPVPVVPLEPVPPPPPRKAVDVAVDWLREALTPDAVPVLRIEELAGEAEIKPRTLRRARDKAGAQTYKHGGVWWLKLPDEEDDQQKAGRIPARPRRRRGLNS